MIDDFYEPTLGDYVTAMWRRKWILAVGALLGVVLVLVAPVGRSGDYSSSVTIRVDDSRALAETLQLGLLPNRASSATAEANRAVADASRAAFEAEADHAATVAVSADEANSQFTLTFTADSAAQATSDARAFSTMVVTRRGEERRKELDDAIAVTTAQLAAQTAERDRLAEELTLAGAGAAESLVIQTTAASDAVVGLQQRLTGLEELASLNTGNLTVAGDASAASESSGWGTTTRIGLGLFAGLLVAAVVIVVLTATDRRLGRRRDVELVAGTTPVLGVVDRRGDAGLVASTGLALGRRVDVARVDVLAVDAAADSDEAVRLLSADAPVQLVAGGAVMGGAAQLGDGSVVLVVANARTTTDDGLNAALTLLGDLSVQIAGIVLIGVDPRDLPGAAASVVASDPSLRESVGSAPG